MKRINQYLLSLAMVITCVSFAACGDDDENQSHSGLIGKWQAIEEEETITIDGELKGQYNENSEWILILKEDGTFLSEFEEDGDIAIDGEGTWTANDNNSKLTLLFKENEGIDEEGGDILTYDMTFQDNKMILTSRETYNENGHVYEEYERRVLVKR